MKKLIALTLICALLLPAYGKGNENPVRRNNYVVGAAEQGCREEFAARAVGVGSVIETKEKERQEQNNHFSNVLSLNAPSLKVIEQPSRIEESIDGQRVTGEYVGKGSGDIVEETIRFPEVDDKALSFHGNEGKEGSDKDKDGKKCNDWSDDHCHYYFEMRGENFLGTDDGAKTLQSGNGEILFGTKAGWSSWKRLKDWTS